MMKFKDWFTSLSKIMRFALVCGAFIFISGGVMASPISPLGAVFDRDDVKVETITETVAIDFSTRLKLDDTLEKGKTEIKQYGSKGEKDIVFQITYINGVEASRKKISETIVIKPIDKVVSKGIKEQQTTQDSFGLPNNEYGSFSPVGETEVSQLPQEETEPICDNALKQSFIKQKESTKNLYETNVSAENTRYEIEIDSINSDWNSRGMYYSGGREEEIQEAETKHANNLASLENTYTSDIAAINQQMETYGCI